MVAIHGEGEVFEPGTEERQAGSNPAPRAGGESEATGERAGDALEDAPSAVPQAGGRPADADAWAPGDYPPDLFAPDYRLIDGVPGQVGFVRQYKVHVPPGYDREHAMPVVFCLHGLHQDALMFCANGGAVVAKANAAGFIVVMPNGIDGSWNGGTCCGSAAEQGLDDVGLMRAIFAEISRHLHIDRSRVYALGFANGGFLGYRLACEASDLFAAVAVGATGLGLDALGAGMQPNGDFDVCEPEHPVSLLHIHGTADTYFPHATQTPALELMAARNGCANSRQPAAAPATRGQAACLGFEGCPQGVDVVGCTVADGGHVWFGTEDCGTGAGGLGCLFAGANTDDIRNTDVAWDFFRAHGRASDLAEP